MKNKSIFSETFEIQFIKNTFCTQTTKNTILGHFGGYDRELGREPRDDGRERPVSQNGIFVVFNVQSVQTHVLLQPSGDNLPSF